MRITPFPGVLTSQMVERPFITKLGNAGCIRVRAWVLTEEQKADILRRFDELKKYMDTPPNFPGGRK